MYKKSALSIVLLLLCVFSLQAYAHSFSEQKKDLQLVLFGIDNFYACQERKQRDAIEVLAYAQNILADEFNGISNRAFSERLKRLQEYGVQGIPSSIDEIDFTCGSSHEKYTNVRWIPYIIPEKGNWKVRKHILEATVRKIFVNGSAGQCDAFAALIFYVHQIGDIATTTYHAETFQLAKGNVGENNADILYDLTKVYLPRLFSSQKSSKEYETLMRKLNEKAKAARSNASSPGNLNTLKKTQDNSKYAEDVIGILSEYVPILLHNELFFNSVFPEISIKFQN